ncbi:CoA-disulfide reductase / Disulfide bond regulator [Thermobrachium celere DSM 8682]|uniref:CoA-disulfide reductase / Disulfide bond regulator n=2 Tax=Thermobrachium TaxID=150333 RepID=R7RLU7_9CLOT|nr:CoA-disulfide reductase / Disulfide bond regulator [Thermobrachium celere DSM 8682]
MNEIPKDKKIIVYCKIGLRGYIAYRILVQNGYDVYNLSGGYDLVLAYQMKYGEGLKLNDEMTRFEPMEEKRKLSQVEIHASSKSKIILSAPSIGAFLIHTWIIPRHKKHSSSKLHIKHLTTLLFLLQFQLELL